MNLIVALDKQSPKSFEYVFPGTLNVYNKFSANPSDRCWDILQYTSANVNLVVVNVVVEIFLDLSGGPTDLQATSMDKNPSTEQDSSQVLVLLLKSVDKF